MKKNLLISRITPHLRYLFRFKIFLTLFFLCSVNGLVRGQGTCLSPDGPMMDYTGGIFSSTTANANGWCYDNLNAGQTYCFWFIYPSSSTTLEMEFTTNCDSCERYYISINTGSGATGSIITTSGLSRCGGSGSFSGGCSRINVTGPPPGTVCTDCAPELYDQSCALIHSNGFMGGNSCPMTAGNKYTYCFKVPDGCGGKNFCPLLRCATGGCGSLMPVELLYFTAVDINGKVQLNWATAAETNNDYFTIERSKNAADFELLTTVKGAGNSSSTLSYQTIDEKPLPGVSYYRLRQTDFNGAYVNFSIVSVKNSPGISVYPTVSSGIVAVTGIEELNSEITVYSMPGEKVYEAAALKGEGEQNSSLQGGGQTLDLSSLPAGIYIVQVKTERKLYTQKLIIQK